MFVSTNQDPAFEHSKFFEIIKQDGGDFLDVLDARLISRIRSIRTWSPYVWQNGVNLPNLSFRYYRNTTAFWVIAIYNGIVDPMSIQEGEIIKIPAYTDITQVLADVTKRKRASAADQTSSSKTVTI